MIEQTEFTYSLLGNAFKNVKPLKIKGKKQIEAIMNKREKQLGLVNNNNLSLKGKERKEIFYKFVKKDLKK